MKPFLRPHTSRAHLALGFALAGSSLTACSGDEDFNAKLAGQYSIAITNGASTCGGEWTEGEMNTGIPFVITQNGRNVTGEVQGVAAVSLFLLLGTNPTTFTGTVSANDFSMVAHGVRAQVEGNCTYTFDATIDGTSTGDSVEGTVTYTPRGNGNSDCAAVTCSAQQRYAGSRPPT